MDLQFPYFVSRTAQKKIKMKVLCINLKRRPDRLEAVKRELPQEWREIVEFTTNYPGPVDGESIKSETDLKDAGISLYKNWKLEGSPNSFWNREMKLGEIGCAYSHFSVWKRAQSLFESDESLKYVVILEDDAKFAADAPKKIEKAVETLQIFAPDWDFLFLGRVLQNGRVDVPFVENLVTPGFSYCLYGYALSKSGVSKLLSHGFMENIIPVDEYVPAMHLVHPRADIAHLYKPVMKAFAFSVGSDVVFQKTKNEAGSDTEKSALWKPEIKTRI